MSDYVMWIPIVFTLEELEDLSQDAPNWDCFQRMRAAIDQAREHKAVLDKQIADNERKNWELEMAEEFGYKGLHDPLDPR